MRSATLRQPSSDHIVSFFLVHTRTHVGRMGAKEFLVHRMMRLVVCGTAASEIGL